MSRPRVVIDTDPGIDDTCAILLALKYHKLGKIKIEGISVVNGNCSTFHGARNVGRILSTVGVTDVPIYKGCNEALVVIKPRKGLYEYHGSDGFNDIEWKEGETFERYLSNEPAYSFINSTITKYPDEVSIVCLGPLTNLALAVKVNPSVANKMKALYFMGGNYQSFGNTPQVAEFNFSMDPESAFVVLDRIKNVPVFAVPLETCDKECVITCKWREEVLGKIDSPAVKLLNLIESPKDYAMGYKGKDHWVLYDQLIVAALLEPKLIDKVFETPVIVELAGKHTRGQMLPVHEFMDSSLKDGNVKIIQSFNVEALKKFLLESLAN
ncbi:unnamed protein product [Lepeophtheirus salmonis]|uniref:(salmon louse) hypothetical protein n=1 Tax=Lepeophtheirus salmonis TaxID=72036 RepID=A0A7R8D0E3_LEPSM|nr:unnamed protein product [Lepeophtheirus salmonis]CAF2982640.1 unnamed protein product [Lepeophtheirus salmonis]